MWASIVLVLDAIEWQMRARVNFIESSKMKYDVELGQE